MVTVATEGGVAGVEEGVVAEATTEEEEEEGKVLVISLVGIMGGGEHGDFPPGYLKSLQFLKCTVLERDIVSSPEEPPIL
jgi:hypothetical protein